jgi:predicted PurR-regulated permease PerM
MWRKDAFGWGFSFALGAAILAVLLFLGWRLLEAVMGIATPFFVGIAIAILLDPLVNRIQRQWVKGRRLPAVTIVFVGFLAVFAGILAFVIPNLITQTQSLVHWFTPITYTVKRKTSENGPYATVVSSLASTDYTVKNLVNDSPYIFAVYAVDDSGTTSLIGSPVRVTPVSKTDSSEEGGSEAITTTTTSPVFPQPTPSASPQPSPTASVKTSPPTPSPSPSPTPSPGASEEPQPARERGTREPRRERRPEELPHPRPSIGPVEDGKERFLGTPNTATPTPTPEESVLSLNSFGGASGNGIAYAQEPTVTPSASPSPSPSASVESPSPSPSVSGSPIATPLATQKTVTTVVHPKNGNGKGNTGKRSPKLNAASVVGTTLSATAGDSTVHLRWKAPTTDVSGVDSLRAQIDKWLSGHRKIGPFSLPPNFEAITTQYGDQVTQGLKTYASHIGEIVVSSVSRLLTIVLVPIIIFYVLSDIDRLRGRFLFLLPERARASIQRGAEDVGNVFGSYVRGMLLVSVAYGVTAMIVFAYWLKSYSLLLGVAAGVLYIVPFIGPMVTALLAGVLSLISGLSPGMTMFMLALCLAQNQIFDNLVVPRVVGHSVGLHPLLTLFALFLGGEMFGLWGMLLSVPIAASIQVTLFRLFPKFAAPTPLAMMLGKERPARKSDEDLPPLEE